MSKYLKLDLFVWFFFLFLLFPNAVLSQKNIVSETWKEYLELFAEQNESEDTYADLVETLEFYHENPINLNDTSRDDLLRLFFLNDFLIHSLKAYIAQNGNMLSIYELQYINGFTQEIIALILPFVCTKPIELPKALALKDLRYAKNSFFIGYRHIFEKQKGFSEVEEESADASRYLGSDFGAYFRYKFNLRNRILLGLSGEKDAGEEFFGGSQAKGFDHYSFHLTLNDFGVLERLVVGDYHLQFGQGLTLWTGFGYNMPVDCNLKKFPQNIKPSASLSEYGVMRGGAAKIKMKDFFVSVFYSNTKRDASVAEVSESGEVLVVNSILESGYHRTLTELKNRNALNEMLFGGNIQYRKRFFNVGATAYKLLFSTDIQPTSHPYNIYYFSGNNNFNAGVDGTFRWRSFSFFGEAAMSQNGGAAALVGTQLSLPNNSMIGVLYRSYSVDYQNLYAFPIGQNSNAANEKGFLFTFQTLLPWHIRMILMADIFRFPWLKYLVDAPSSGEEYRINLMKQLNRQTALTFIYRYKDKPANTNSETSKISYVEPFYKHTFQLNFAYRQSSVWSFNSRVEYNIFNSENNLETAGFIICQDINFSPVSVPVSFSFRYALFDAESYENRMYVYEQNLLYEYSTPAYSNNGSRLYLLANWNVNRFFRVGMRYAIWYYPWEKTIGSGLSEIQGNKRQEIGIQLQLKL